MGQTVHTVCGSDSGSVSVPRPLAIYPLTLTHSTFVPFEATSINGPCWSLHMLVVYSVHIHIHMVSLSIRFEIIFN